MTTPGMRRLLVQWRAKAGHEDEVAALLGELRAAVRGEPGCIAFDVWRDAADARTFWLHEIYRDDAAFQAHRRTPHFQEIVTGRAVPLLEVRDIRFVHDL